MPRFHRPFLILCVISLIALLRLHSNLISLSPEPNNASRGSIHHTNKNAPQNYHITFTLHPQTIINPPSQFLSVPGYTCPLTISSLPPSVNQSTIFNFSTTISTNLKILFVGDSIVQQFVQNFYSSVLIHKHDEAKASDYSWKGKDGRYVILRSFINGQEPALSGLHVCSSVARVYGGGVVGYYRLLDLPYRDGRKDYVYCKNEKGWSESDVRELLDYELNEVDGGVVRPLVRANSTHDSAQTTWYKSRDVEGNNGGSSTGQKVQSFNAIVLRPPGPGWMKLHEITRERLLESIQLLHELFHVETVILSTLMFNNNVLTPKDWRQMLEINEMIRDIARNWNGGANSVKFVMVQDLAAFTNEILWMNAKHLGYNVTYNQNQQMNDETVSTWKNEGSTFLLHRLDMTNWKFNPSISMVCNTPPICIPRNITLPNGTSFTIDNLCIMNITADKNQCFFNRFSRDGMHWCMETIGPRYSASIACLLGCVYNGGLDEEYTMASDGERIEVMSRVRQCEMECNRRYMSLVPVEESWLDYGSDVNSRSNNGF